MKQVSFQTEMQPKEVLGEN